MSNIRAMWLVVVRRDAGRGVHRRVRDGHRSVRSMRCSIRDAGEILSSSAGPAVELALKRPRASSITSRGWTAGPLAAFQISPRSTGGSPRRQALENETRIRLGRNGGSVRPGHVVLVAQISRSRKLPPCARIAGEFERRKR